MSNIQERLGQKLRRLREEKGVSQEELSKEAGLDRTYVGKIERGKKSPSLNTVEKLGDALGVEVWELFKF